MQNNQSMDASYAARLEKLQNATWKRMLDVQRPYRLHLTSLNPGFMLDIGCGLGRNLLHNHKNGIGVDQNTECLDIARGRGLQVYTPNEFSQSPLSKGKHFDSLLCSHVLEHMTCAQAIDLIKTYIHYIKPGGKIILITPQEAGFASDPTHVEFMDFAKIRLIFANFDLIPHIERSFPFPKWCGLFFKYNEFVAVATIP